MLGVGLALFLASDLRAQMEERTPPVRPPEETSHSIFSTSRRFVVSGFAAAAAADLARWTEDVAHRLEEQLGPIPLERGWYLEVQAAEGDRVVRAQGWVDGLLQQRLLLGRGDDLDQEDALEGLVWLLLNRWPVIRQTETARQQTLATVPDWLAVGVAQNLYVELRTRNADVVQERWREGRLAAWSDLVEREVLPAGRWAEKAEAGLLVNWMLESRAHLDVLWDACVEGRRMRAVDVAQQVLALGSVADASRAWEIWLAAQQDRRRGVSGINPGQVAEFDALTQFDDTDLQAVRADVKPPLTVADLVALRKSRWVADLATRRSLQLQMTMIGRAPEWQDVARRYVRFLEGLAGRAPGYSGGWLGRGPSARQLQALLADAEAARQHLGSDVQARSDYLDQVEASLHAAGSRGMDSIQTEAERRYLDEVESGATGTSP